MRQPRHFIVIGDSQHYHDLVTAKTAAIRLARNNMGGRVMIYESVGEMVLGQPTWEPHDDPKDTSGRVWAGPGPGIGPS